MSRRKPYDLADAPVSAPVYWTSLDDLDSQLAQDPKAREALAAEFPAHADDFTDPVTRRTFMTLMGAAVSLATLQGCRRPVDNIMPYARLPEGVTVGVPSWYATAMDRHGEAVGLLVESHEGRPTKIEGNPDHPGSPGGGTDLLTQASVLDLYDPDRSRQPAETARGHAEDRTYAQFDTAFAAVLAPHLANNGQGLHVLAQPTISPTFLRLRTAVLQRFPQARFHTWSAASTRATHAGTRLAFGYPMNAVASYERARVIVALDSDFLQTEPGMARNTRGWAEGRRVHGADDPAVGTMGRLYVVESSYTTTGGNADHRLRLPARDIEAYLRALAGRLVSAHNLELGELNNVVRGAAAPPGVEAKWVNAVAHDLIEHRGAGLLVAGPGQPETVHALVHVLNQTLGNTGTTVRYVPVADADEPDHGTDLAALVEAMNNHQVQTLVILGGNPVYDAPGDADVGRALANVATSVHLGYMHDETSEKCTWHVPLAHYLEAWGDLRGMDGALAIQQPLIAPLYGARSEIELLGQMAAVPAARGHDLVRETMRAASPMQPASLEREWRRVLHRGLAAPAPPPQATPSPRAGDLAQRLAGSAAARPVDRSNIEVTFHVDPKMYDGRHANNAWLAELPDPVTRITWDNAAYLSAATATALGVRSGDMIRLTRDNRSIEVVAWVLPGQADWSVGLNLGWGRRRAGRVGTGRGFDVNPLRSSHGLWILDGVTLTKLEGRRYDLSQTQDHHRMEGRPIALETTVDEYREHPNFAERLSPSPRTLPLWRDVSYAEGHKWGLSIDLNACSGCNACAIACQSENNVPVVGKDQVARGREMHWLRVDRYFVSPRGRGDTDPLETSDPLVAHQPLMCVQCEEAPCENVCPVNATVHSPEGLNDMAYNRCIGTRYCANNCPYKVRRFNYLNWHNDGVYQPQDSDVPETVRMQMNPNVTVRFRGVMEKCTYCIQRIQTVKIASKRDGNRPIREGEIRTACQQACPAEAIVFGDLNDRTHRVAVLAEQDRRYKLLGEIGTRPRTTYLAKIRNPNPEMLG